MSKLGAMLLVIIIIMMTLMWYPVPPRAQAPQRLLVVDKPTAGILPNGSYSLRGRAGPESSFLVGLNIGFREIIQIGASFGAQNVFDHGSPVVNDYPGFQVRARILPEGAGPALALGFDSQGQGVYHENLERYDRKSPGFYAVLSKNYQLRLGELSIHGGVSWSTERRDDNDPNVFGAADWTFFERLVLLFAVDGALNDNGDDSFGQSGVYIDAGVGWYFGESLVMSLAFRDLTGNFGPESSVGREFEIVLMQSF